MHVNTRLKVNFDKYGFQLALVNQPVQPYSDNETKSMGDNAQSSRADLAGL